MSGTTEFKTGDEPSFQGLMSDPITALVMQSDGVSPSHVEALARRAASDLRNRNERPR